jgi:hypothetical protein
MLNNEGNVVELNLIKKHKPRELNYHLKVL